MLGPSQLYPPLVHPNVPDSPPIHSSLSPQYVLDPLLAINPVNMSPTVTAAVTDLLSSFDNHPNTVPPVVALPGTSHRKSYPKKKPGQDFLGFMPFCLLISLPGPKVFKFIKEPTKRMKTYSRITMKIERLVCITPPLLPRVQTLSLFVDRTTSCPDKRVRSSVVCRYRLCCPVSIKVIFYR